MKVSRKISKAISTSVNSVFKTPLNDLILDASSFALGNYTVTDAVLKTYDRLIVTNVANVTITFPLGLTPKHRIEINNRLSEVTIIADAYTNYYAVGNLLVGNYIAGTFTIDDSVSISAFGTLTASNS